MGLPGQNSFSKVKTFLDCQTADYEEENKGEQRGKDRGFQSAQSCWEGGVQESWKFLREANGTARV